MGLHPGFHAVSLFSTKDMEAETEILGQTFQGSILGGKLEEFRQSQGFPGWHPGPPSPDGAQDFFLLGPRFSPTTVADCYMC